MRFVVRMRICQEDVEVGWDNGELFGDPRRIRDIQKMAEAYGTSELGPVHPKVRCTRTAAEHLTSPYSVRFLIGELFEKHIISEEGDWPVLRGPS